MENKFGTIKILLLLFFYYFKVEGLSKEESDDEGHPIVSGEDGEIIGKCSACHEMQLNSRGELKCVATPHCCLGRTFRQNCIVDPCFYFKKACPRAHICIPQSCSAAGCKALYYDKKLNLINPTDCHRYVFQRSKSLTSSFSSHSRRPYAIEAAAGYEKPPKIDIPSRLLQTSPNQFKYRENGKQKSKNHQQQIWPSFIDYNGYEKPGACPTHQKYLIQICTSECSKDSECQERKKCCWNGCTNRCINPMQKADANFLNYPISGHWRRL
uniref:WAP domain-containing protein n=1 Tax=Panagrolaimus sp. ES5 TaxID=591445 RepID=A0AC34FZY6_9BILA